MIIRILTTGTNLNVTPNVARVVRVYNYRVPAGITESTFTAAGQLLGSDGADSPAVVPAPTVEGQMLVARLGETVKMDWESVDLTQLTQTAVKTAAYTAAANDHVLVNASATSNDFAITLPGSPADGTKVRVTLLAGHATYKVTIGRNSSLINGGTTTDEYTLHNAGDSVYFEYTGSTLGWMPLTNYVSLTRVTSSATVTPTGSARRNYLRVTAQAEAVTIAAPAGTAVDGNMVLIRMEDNGTARAITWNAIYRAIGVTLPTTTVLGKLMYVLASYNSADTKWDVTTVAQEA